MAHPPGKINGSQILSKPTKAEPPACCYDKVRIPPLETRRVFTELVRSYKPARVDDLRAMLTLMQRLDKQKSGEYARLRKDLETVAVVTDNRFSLTQNQIGQLASYTLPTTEP
jgi:hypothetical protein